MKPLEHDFVIATCRPRTACCCRYLVMSPRGWGCAKLTTMGWTIDERVAAGTMKATGDNCPGVADTI